MPASASIPNGLYSVGTKVYGPITLDDADGNIRVDLDRTVNQGLNSRTPTTTVRVVMEVSFDGGVSWMNQGSTTFEGGIRTDPELGQLNADFLEGTIYGARSGMVRLFRVSVEVAGSTVRLAGTVSVF
jgi:hypothetical protein